MHQGEYDGLAGAEPDVVELNVALTLVGPLPGITVHGPVAFVQAPDQPAKTLPAAGLAVNVTLSPT